MRSLDLAREECERFHPGLVESLTSVPFAERESPGSPVVELFRKHSGAGLLVPAVYGGLGADALEAVRVTRAIGSCSPSLAVAATMHNFTAAMLFALTDRVLRPSAAQSELLGRIAPDGLLLASGWAEGRTEQNILNPAVRATEVEGGFEVDGSKKPCSLSHSMSMLTASAILPAGGPEDPLALAILLIPADSPGITRHPFWSSPVLAGAQSDEVRLERVFVPDRLVIRATPEDPGRLDDLQTAAFIWFELLVTSAYVGVVSTLAEAVFQRARGSVTDRAALGVHLETAVGLTEGMARELRDGAGGDDAVAAQKALAAAADLAIELAGGIAFIGSGELGYLAAAVHPLAFHPPSRTSTAQALADYFGGGPLLLS
jgi:alkylation response protein AidB-like acyl-CoA dehydrogenase